MADQRKTTKARKRKDAEPATKAPDKATKEEYNIARWMRNNVPVKKTKFLSHTVEYFTACKAVDKLMDSPWAQPQKAGEEALFTTRESIVEYLDTMLRHKLFHRARKIIVPENELKSKKKKDREEKERAQKKDEKEVKEVKDSGAKAKSEDVGESSQAETEKAEKAVEKSTKKDDADKKKRKVRLDMHLEQTFVDGIDAYVWIYEPTPYYYYFFGLLVVVAVIAICLFPLWPSSVRQGVYYLSLAAAGFLVFILALAVLRLLVFCTVWAISLSYAHLWLLPNLTEDVGFFASFWPLYKYEYKGNVDESSSKNETESEATDQVEEAAASSSKSDYPKQGSSDSGGKTDPSHSETESESSQKSQTGKDFELVDPDEIES